MTSGKMHHHRQCPISWNRLKKIKNCKDTKTKFAKLITYLCNKNNINNNNNQEMVIEWPISCLVKIQINLRGKKLKGTNSAIRDMNPAIPKMTNVTEESRERSIIFSKMCERAGGQHGQHFPL